MFCSRKKPTETLSPLKMRTHPIESFHDLLEALEVTVKSMEESKREVEGLISNEKWENSSLPNLKLLKTDTQNVGSELIKDIENLAKGVRALLLINESFEKAATGGS